MIFPVVLCTYVRSIYPPFSLVIGNSGFQSRPVFGHRKSMVMKTAKFLTAGRNHFAKSCFSKPCTLFTEQWVFSLFQTKPHGTIKWDICLDYCFRPYAEAKGKLQNADYQRSCAGMFAKENSLEHLWAKHNGDHRPFARQMRSLSVSDIVVLTQGGKKTAYYADTFGFQEVPEFLAQQRVQKKHKERGEAR